MILTGRAKESIDPRVLEAAPRDSVRPLSERLHALGFRVQDLVAARDYPHVPIRVRELQGDVRDWRIRVHQPSPGWQRACVAPPGGRTPRTCCVNGSRRDWAISKQGSNSP